MELYRDLARPRGSTGGQARTLRNRYESEPPPMPAPRRRLAVVPLAIALASVWAVAFFLAEAAQGAVLRVGTYEGKHGQYTSIQAALAAAKPGDWVLLGPGDYKQSSFSPIPGALGDDKAGADILITTPNIHVRGMNRNTVMIDGTKPGTPQCSPQTADQNFGPAEGSSFLGNNGVVVYKASGVWLQ